MRSVPEKIASILGDRPYTVNETGMSGSEVRIYDDYVLKIGKRNAETENEYAVVQWLQGRLPVPQIPVYAVEGENAYTLMSRVKGKMLCDEVLMKEPEQVIDLTAKGLKLLWNVDISGCPEGVSPLEERLKEAEYNVIHGLVDVDEVEPETFGPDGFKDPEDLLDWLKTNRPPEDRVFTHGDYCLPNVFASEGEISGFIDLGKAGAADRWQDVAIAIRTLDHNFRGVYTDGKTIYDFRPEMLLKKLGIEMDEKKFRYYLLLDELF